MPSTPKKKTSRREILCSTRPGKSFGSQAPQAQTTTSGARRVGGRRAAYLEAEPGRERACRTARVEHARVGLEEHGAQILAAERRVETPGLFRGQALAGDPEPSQRRLAPRGEVAVAAVEPRDSDRLEQPQPGLGLEVAPELEGAPGKERVPLDVAVREAQKARVPTGAGAHVAGRVLLDERHVPAAPRQLARGRSAEDAGADDDGGIHAGSVGVTLSWRTSGRW